MKAEADKTGSKKFRAIAGIAPAQLKSGDQFADNRVEVVAQRELAGKANNSPQAERIAQLQAMADGSAVGAVQRQELEEEPLQGKFEAIQKQGEEEELLQGKFETIQKQGEEEELLQGKFETIQKQGEEEELLQGKFEAIQKQGEEELLQGKFETVQNKNEKPVNNTGLPDRLKSGTEGLSGFSMDDVKVHYNSAKPARLQAHAFAQGTDIHMASGQEKHLPHEAWHVVQQKQGRVKPTLQMKGGVKVNDDIGLEKEADAMGEKALTSQFKVTDQSSTQFKRSAVSAPISNQRMVIQRLAITKASAGKVTASGQDRLEVPIEVSKDDGSSMTITLNTSYKKHMIEAYTSGGIEITAAAAAQNTIAKLSEAEFKKAFEDFAFLFATQLKGSDPTTFSPSAAVNELTTSKGLSFHSDNAFLGAAVHGFPTVTAGNAVVLSQQEFQDLKLLTNLAYHTSGNLNGGSIAQANAALGRYNASANIGNLFTAEQIASIGRLIRAKIRASNENDQDVRDIRRETGILGAKVRRGEVTAVDALVNGKPLNIE